MSTSDHIASPARSRWGRARFGGGSGLLVALSLMLGAILVLAAADFVVRYLLAKKADS